MRALLIFSLFASLLLLNSACHSSDLRDEMVRFDRTYVPVLYYVHLGDVDRAERAALVMDSYWKKLRKNYDQQNRELDWGGRWALVDGWIAGSKQALEEKDLFLAYNQLDHIRYELMVLRSQQAIPYYLDYLWDFEASMDMAVETALDPMLCLMEYKEFQALTQDLKTAWQEVVDFPLDHRIYLLDAQVRMELAYSRKEMTGLINTFVDAVEEGDHLEAACLARELPPAYLDVLAPHGDMEASMVHYARIFPLSENN
ncbi:MAG: hypothetical protein AAFP19_21895 [Bacteroidota bacterium]